MTRTRWVALASLACLGVLPARGQARPLIGNGRQHARLTLETITATASRVQVLVVLHVDEGWHVSWRNPGETGLPTRLAWSLPQGVRVVGETWPVPIVAQTTVGSTHTMEGAVPWLVEFARDSAVRGDRLIALTMRYGVCRDVCIPEQLTVQGAWPEAPIRAAVPPALRAQLVVAGGAVKAQRLSPTRLCLVDAPLGDGSALPAVVADSGLELDATLQLVPGRNVHGKVMNIPATAPLRSGTELLFVRAGKGVSARLDLVRRLPECAAR